MLASQVFDNRQLVYTADWFWSVIVYDKHTRSMLQSDSQSPGVSRQ